MIQKSPKTLQLLVEKIIVDPSVLKDDFFKKILEQAALDFWHIAIALNGGNEREFNLNRCGTTIQGIQATCLACNSDRENIDWKWLLSDVKEIGKTCDFELSNNVYWNSPYRLHALSQYERITPYIKESQ